MTSNRRLNRENKTVQLMIRMYCRNIHNTKTDLCDECRELSQYAEKRVAKCPYGYNKPTCANCTTHCYAPSKRDAIRRVMRYAGPRMLVRHPVLAVMHLVDGWRETRSNANRQ